MPAFQPRRKQLAKMADSSAVRFGTVAGDFGGDTLPESRAQSVLLRGRPSLHMGATRAQVRTYGGKFRNGFGSFLEDQELCDVTIVAPGSGREHKAHMLILSYHSEFFKRAFTADFREKEERRITLGFDDPAGVWPIMLEFFYTDEVVLTDETVLPLLAMSRELMVKSIEEYCSDYAQSSLEASNAIHYLNQAVQFNCETFRQSCVALVAEGFPSSFSKPTDGLPCEVMLEVLTHPNLVVQTEEQVLAFILNYVPRHELTQEMIRKLYEQVRFPFLSNERLAALTQEETVPKDLLLTAMALRLSLIDHPERLAALVAMSQPNQGASAASIPPSPTPCTLVSRQGARQVASSWSHSGTSNAAPEPRSNGAVADAMAAAGIPMGNTTSQMSMAAQGNGLGSCRQSYSGMSGPTGNNNNNTSCSGSLSLPLPPAVSAALSVTSGSPATSSSGLPHGLPPHSVLPRKTYVCSIEYGLPGGSEYACVPLHEVWEDLVPQLHVRVSGDVVEGDAQSILRVSEGDSSWFMVSGDAGAAQPVWIEVEFPPNMRVVEMTKYTFSHGMNFANHMFPYGISDSAWLQMKGLYTQVAEGEGEAFYTLRTSESSASTVQFEYMVSVESGQVPPRVPAWRRLRISTSEEQSSGSVRLSVRKLRLFGRLEISLTREGPPGARDLLANWRRRKEVVAARQNAAARKSIATATLSMNNSSMQ